MEFNLLPFLCEAFATNEKIYKDIDKLYKKNKYEFYRLAKSHSLYNHPMANENSLIQDEYFKKSLGIFLGQEGYGEIIYKIIKKGWRYAYIYVKNHSCIDLEEFLMSFVKKNKGLDNINDDYLNSNAIMVLQIADIEEKEVKENEALSFLLNALKMRWDHYTNKNKLRIDYNSISAEDKQQVLKLKRLIFKKYGDLKSLTCNIKDKEMAKYSSMVDCMFDYENISLVSIANDVNFTDRDIEELLYLWVLGYGGNEIKNATRFLILAIRIKYFCKSYKKVKEHYFKNNKETMFIEVENMQKWLDKSNVEIKQKENIIKELEEKIKQLERENKRLQDNIQESKYNKQELQGLRELMFEMNEEHENISIDSNEISIDMEMINNINGLIIGGTDSWQKNMKKLLPGFKFISCNALNFDIRLLDKVDYIFVYVNYLSHALYYKVIQNADNKKIGYLNISNEKLVLKKIEEFIKYQDEFRKRKIF